MDVHVLPVDWLTHKEALQAIRGAVFIEEQGVPKEIEWDGEDDVSSPLHGHQRGRAAGRLREAACPAAGSAGWPCCPSIRGNGIGRQILDAAVAQGLPSWASDG